MDRRGLLDSTDDLRDEEEGDGLVDMDIGSIRQRQAAMISEQDEGLGFLAKAVARQKEMAHTIGGELDRQDEIIDDLHDHVDRTDNRITRETHHIREVTLKDQKGNCVLWVIAILLFIGIIVVAVIPNN